MAIESGSGMFPVVDIPAYESGSAALAETLFARLQRNRRSGSYPRMPEWEVLGQPSLFSFVRPFPLRVGPNRLVRHALPWQHGRPDRPVGLSGEQ